MYKSYSSSQAFDCLIKVLRSPLRAKSDLDTSLLRDTNNTLILKIKFEGNLYPFSLSVQQSEEEWRAKTRKETKTESFGSLVMGIIAKKNSYSIQVDNRGLQKSDMEATASLWYRA